ncbi:MAG: flavin reductase family protein [Acholeplasmatales bacterium]|nr:flavin reductase family protein [Acholeplasmatales bacterium]
MRKNFKEQSWVFPMPVFILGTYNEIGTANAMTAAWAGIYDTNKVFVSLSSHKTTDNFKRTGAFTVSFATKEYAKECDYVGIVSGNKVPDKVARAGLTPVKSEFVNAPYFEELKVALECEVSKIIEDEDGIKLIGDIINVSADESVLTNGKIDTEKLEPLSFDPANNRYYTINEYVADAFKVGIELRNK